MNGDEMLKRLKNNVLDQDRFGNLTVTNASVQGKYLLISCENLKSRCEICDVRIRYDIASNHFSLLANYFLP